MEGDILRAAHQIQAQQAALAGLRAHYAGQLMVCLLDWEASGCADVPDMHAVDWDATANLAVIAADALIAALARPPAAR